MPQKLVLGWAEERYDLVAKHLQICAWSQKPRALVVAEYAEPWGLASSSVAALLQKKSSDPLDLGLKGREAHEMAVYEKYDRS